MYPAKAVEDWRFDFTAVAESENKTQLLFKQSIIIK